MGLSYSLGERSFDNGMAEEFYRQGIEDLIEIGISEHTCRFYQAAGLLDSYELRKDG